MAETLLGGGGDFPRCVFDRTMACSSATMHRLSIRRLYAAVGSTTEKN